MPDANRWSSANLSSVCREGLDQRLSSIGLFGRGIYSSDSPVKANTYWQGSNPYGIRYMLSLSVLLGRCKVVFKHNIATLTSLQEYPAGICDQRLLREPDGFDSVTGNVTGHSEFVTYDNSRVHIDYIIGYKADLTVLPLPPQRMSVSRLRRRRARHRHRSSRSSRCRHSSAPGSLTSSSASHHSRRHSSHRHKSRHQSINNALTPSALSAMLMPFISLTSPSTVAANPSSGSFTQPRASVLPPSAGAALAAEVEGESNTSSSDSS